MNKQDLIDFELRIKALFEQGKLPYLIHLCGGNEDQLIEIFKDIKPGDWIFSSHRSHYHYLLAGGDPDLLEEIIREGRSMFVFDRKLNFYTSSVLAGTCGISAGVAHALKEQGSAAKVWCFLGDGAEDEGHFYEAVNYVAGADLPCTFIIEDNKKSVCTPTPDVWGRDLPYYLESKEYNGGILKQPHLYYYQYSNTKYPHAGAGKRVQF
jgi:pyruvate dehydrogenase E1 component alpha subunit